MLEENTRIDKSVEYRRAGLGELWGCVVIKYEMDIFADKFRFGRRCNENGHLRDSLAHCLRSYVDD